MTINSILTEAECFRMYLNNNNLPKILQQQQQQSFLKHSYKQQHGIQTQDKIHPIMAKATRIRMRQNHQTNLHFPTAVLNIEPSWSHSVIGFPGQSPSTTHISSIPSPSSICRLVLSNCLLASSYASLRYLSTEFATIRIQFCNRML